MATSQLHEDFSREEHVKAGSDRGFGFVVVVAGALFGFAAGVDGLVPGAVFTEPVDGVESLPCDLLLRGW